MLSVEEARALSEIEPELAKLRRENHTVFSSKPILTLGDLQISRMFVKMFHGIKNSSPPKASVLPYTVQNVQIPVRDGAVVAARVYTPKHRPAQGCPGIFLCHGGGFVIADLDGQDGVGKVGTMLGGIVVDVLYRVAPEFPFPTAVMDCYDGLKWVMGNLAELHINPSRGMIVMGESNGADIAMAIAQLYAAEKPPLSPPLTGMFLACPIAMVKDAVPEKYKDHFVSMEQNAESPILGTKSLEFFQSLYRPDLTSPLAIPILFPNPQIWPKTFMQVCGMDPARDGGLIVEDILKEAGVETKLDLYPGLPHGFWGPFMHASFTKGHEKRTTEGLSWLLKGSQ